jgi:hypothetical protein
MAGSTKNYDTSTFVVDTYGELWAGLAVPAAGARLTLHTDGTPESVANPNAVHLGHTKDGIKVTITNALTKHYVDEQASPVKTTVETVDMMLEGTFNQILDEDVLKKLTAGFGSYSTASGYKQFTIGRKAITYDSVALIYPNPEDPTKFVVVHMYNAVNEGGLGYGVSRKTLAEMPFKFVAYALSSRAAADAVGNHWWQTA